MSTANRYEARFVLAGFPTVIRPVFWLVIAMLGFPASLDKVGVVSLLLWVALACLAILIHELGHALAVRRFGGRANIELYAGGGLTHYSAGDWITRGRSIAISLSGPAAGFVAGGVGYLIEQAAGPDPGWVLGMALSFWFWINIAWGCFNLLPVLPLDGGHVAEDLLGWRTARLVSLVVGTGVAILGLFLGWWWVALILAWSVGKSYSELYGQTWFGGGTLRRPKRKDGPKPSKRAAKAQGGPLDEATIDTLYAQLEGSTEPSRETDAAMVEQLYDAGRFEAAAAVASGAFERFRRPIDAYNAAACFARAGKPEAGLTWLEKAIEAGYNDLKHIGSDPDLESVRALDGYPDVRRRLLN